MANVSSWEGVEAATKRTQRLKGVGVKPVISPTYTNFGRLLKSCDIILSIEVLTNLPILSTQV
jgi:hypothetical protein